MRDATLTSPSTPPPSSPPSSPSASLPWPRPLGVPHLPFPPAPPPHPAAQPLGSPTPAALPSRPAPTPPVAAAPAPASVSPPSDPAAEGMGRREEEASPERVVRVDRARVRAASTCSTHPQPAVEHPRCVMDQRHAATLLPSMCAMQHCRDALATAVNPPHGAARLVALNMCARPSQIPMRRGPLP
jgi:hypothetical protein